MTPRPLPQPGGLGPSLGLQARAPSFLAVPQHLHAQSMNLRAGDRDRHAVQRPNGVGLLNGDPGSR
jgi:hypothetical protein